MSGFIGFVFGFLVGACVLHEPWRTWFVAQWDKVFKR